MIEIGPAGETLATVRSASAVPVCTSAHAGRSSAKAMTNTRRIEDPLLVRGSRGDGNRSNGKQASTDRAPPTVASHPTLPALQRDEIGLAHPAWATVGLATGTGILA